MKIGIIGYGFVGQAVHYSLTSEPVIYDINKKYNNFDEILKTDVVFICVGTPLKLGKMDASAVNDTLEFLKGYEGLVVIKSTIHPSYIDENELNIVSNPEFLKENNFLQDFEEQTDIFIGGTVKQCKLLKYIYLREFRLTKSPEFHFMSFDEALIFKYLRNIKIAYEVMWHEFVQDSTGNYKKYQNFMKKLSVKVENIMLDGNRGFGGSCLPKDVKAYPEHVLTDFLLDYNSSIREPL